jgi:hypothetical protein
VVCLDGGLARAVGASAQQQAGTTSRLPGCASSALIIRLNNWTRETKASVLWMESVVVTLRADRPDAVDISQSDGPAAAL